MLIPRPHLKLVMISLSLGVTFAMSGCTRPERKPIDEVTEKPQPGETSSGADAEVDMANDLGDMMGDSDMSSVDCVEDVRQSALLDLGVPGEMASAIEVLEGGPDLDADEVEDTIVQVFLEEHRKIGIYLSNNGCLTFAGGFVATSTEILESSNEGVRDLDAWLPAECANDLGGVLTRHRYDGERYRVDLTIDCPCDPEALRDPECPQP